MSFKKPNILNLVTVPVLLLLFVSFKCVSGDQQARETQSFSIPEDSLIIPVAVKTSLRDSIVDFGMGLLGTKYVSGACSKDGFDCSGLVYYVFSHFKVEIPRSSSEFKNFGREVPIDKVKKGDILVFLSPTRNAIGHVGIVTNPNGMASDFIHASSGREMKVIITSLKNEGYTKRFVKAVDVLQ